MKVVRFRPRWRPVDVALFATAGATVLGLSFLSSWLLAVAHWPWAPRDFVDLFAPQPIETVEAMLIGGVLALLAGIVLGAAVGAVYNLLGRLIQARSKPKS